MKKKLYLKELESEAIFILREVVAEFKKPVMLYSVGKDSSVMLHLARKAFFPSKIPFPLLHVDTGYKFREMYEFRDSFTKEIGANLIIYRNEDAIEKGFHPSNDSEGFSAQEILLIKNRELHGINKVKLKQLSQVAINACLDGRELSSREFFRKIKI